MASLLITIFLAIALLLDNSPVEGKELGTFGETFPIQEEDLLLVLRARLANADTSKQKQIAQTLLGTVQKPKLTLLLRANKERAFTFDPSIVLQEDITDINGNLLFHKGQVVNPLESTSLTKTLLFFDATDQEQLAWAKRHTGTWILTNGEPLTLEKEEGKSVFFDQGGYLVKKLGITALPAQVSQQEKVLLVKEVPCSL